MLHPAIELRDSPVAGKGLFATAPITAGEVVWQTAKEDLEPIYEREKIVGWPIEKQQTFFSLAYQVGPSHWSGPLGRETDDPADFYNHSCDPTTWFVDNLTMVARRNIAPGDEITYDYATSHSQDPAYGFLCRCGTSVCRGRMNGTDWQTHPELHERYGEHAMRHVLGSGRFA